MVTSFRDLNVGDKVVRMLAGVIPMDMVVVKVEQDLLWCGLADRSGPTWSFSRNNGAEIDEELGWDESHTGSYLVLNA